MPQYNFIDLTDKEINNWTVLYLDENNHAKWICKCICGNIKSVWGCHLRSGKTFSCRVCSEHKHKGRLNSKLLHHIKYRAKIRNLEFNLTKEYLYDLFYNKQKCKFNLTGYTLTISNTIEGHTKGETTASLDRIDSSKGYTEDNVQWVHKDINKMKNDLLQHQFIELCKAVANHDSTNN
jgi:hypothetical protein